MAVSMVTLVAPVRGEFVPVACPWSEWTATGASTEMASTDDATRPFDNESATTTQPLRTDTADFTTTAESDTHANAVDIVLPKDTLKLLSIPGPVAAAPTTVTLTDAVAGTFNRPKPSDSGPIWMETARVIVPEAAKTVPPTEAITAADEAHMAPAANTFRTRAEDEDQFVQDDLLPRPRLERGEEQNEPADSPTTVTLAAPVGGRFTPITLDTLATSAVTNRLTLPSRTVPQPSLTTTACPP